MPQIRSKTFGFRVLLEIQAVAAKLATEHNPKRIEALIAKLNKLYDVWSRVDERRNSKRN